MKRCAASISSINRLPPSRAASGSIEASVLRGAFIGFGNVAAKGHLPGWLSRNDVRIVAATDARPGAPRSVSRSMSATGAGMTAWTTCCPAKRSISSTSARRPGSHAALIKRALDAGLHVLCEKPLVTRWRTREAVAAAARAPGASSIRFTIGSCADLPQDLGADRRGRDRRRPIRPVGRHLRTQPAVAATSEGGKNWRVDPAMAGGGILFDHGWHALYCVARWAGAPARRRRARSKRAASTNGRSKTRRLSTLDLAFGERRIFLTWTAERALQSYRDRGRTRPDPCRSATRLSLRSKSAERRWSCPPSLSEGSHHPDWFVGVAEDFVARGDGGGQGQHRRGGAMRPADRPCPAVERRGRRAAVTGRLGQAFSRRFRPVCNSLRAGGCLRHEKPLARREEHHQEKVDRRTDRGQKQEPVRLAEQRKDRARDR